MSGLRFLIVSLMAGSVLSAEYFWGRCPSVPPMNEFDMKKFEGLWYVVEAFDNGERCMSLNITRSDSPDTWSIVEEKENGLFNALRLPHSTFNTGKISVPDKNNSAAMAVIWRLSGIAGHASFTVHNTDYEQFASVFECQNVGLFHRQTGLVLSRTPMLRVDLRQMARIHTPDIKVAYYKRVSQSPCKYRRRQPEESRPAPPLHNQDDQWATFNGVPNS
ncbi:apolipoprotein D-like [Macrobrachium rosenbergii]|uniref:apolipoprotein D-like n=1 Tax=Macrobrachium rosenbergii TaxID=79674 RepID=UPI0034D519AA